MNCFHYTPGYLSLSRKNLSWHKNNFHSFPHISLLSTLALLKNWGIVFLPAAPRPAFSSNHTPQSVGRKLTTLRERSVRIREVEGSSPFESTMLSKQYRCRRRNAYGINCFRVFSPQNFTENSIDANRCFSVTDGSRTPFSPEICVGIPTWHPF